MSSSPSSVRVPRASIAVPAASALTSSPRAGLLQRKCACGAQSHGNAECADCAKKRNTLQRKLTIGASNDPLELEADRVADQVLRGPRDAGASATPLRIQRYSAQANKSADAAPESVDRVLASSGRPLDAALRGDMEQRFGHDFSQVRVHRGEAAAQSARAINANAYTVGQHIVFNNGEYAPQTQEGRRLLAHELTHVVQQQGAPRARVMREPRREEGKDECKIRNPRAYVYFEIERRFNDPTDSDPRVLTRARCLKKAFGLLEARDAVEFAQQIMQRQGIYTAYMMLHHATRLALAEILAARLAQKDTPTYEARLLTGDVYLPPDSPEFPAPELSVDVIPNGIAVKLDKPVLAVGSAALLGRAECDKFTFGFTQFLVEEDDAQEFYFPDLNSYLVFDKGLGLAPFLPCYDVFNTGDVWSYSGKLKCDSKGPVKNFGEDRPIFQDTPQTPFADSGSDKLLPSAFKLWQKFVLAFYAMLPNGAVHFFSWFDWTIAYCKTFPHTLDARKSIGSLPADKPAHQVTINPVRQGAPGAPLASKAGKPAPKACNDLAKNTPAVTYQWPFPTVKC